MESSVGSPGQCTEADGQLAFRRPQPRDLPGLLQERWTQRPPRWTPTLHTVSHRQIRSQTLWVNFLGVYLSQTDNTHQEAGPQMPPVQNLSSLKTEGQQRPEWPWSLAWPSSLPGSIRPRGAGGCGPCPGPTNTQHGPRVSTGPYGPPRLASGSTATQRQQGPAPGQRLPPKPQEAESTGLASDPASLQGTMVRHCDQSQRAPHG